MVLVDFVSLLSLVTWDDGKKAGLEAVLAIFSMPFFPGTVGMSGGGYPGRSS